MPADAADLSGLWLDPALGDGITDTHYHDIPVGRPKDFYRVHPDQAFRRRSQIVLVKNENDIDKQYFLVAPGMQGRIAEARPVTVVVCVSRDGRPRLWPLVFPREGEKDIGAWASERACARDGISNWVKAIWVGRSFLTREAQPGYAPDPDWTKLPTWDEMIVLGFGRHGVIADEDHPVFRDLMGAPRKAGCDGDDL
jgi:hypothetical protein